MTARPYSSMKAMSSWRVDAGKPDLEVELRDVEGAQVHGELSTHPWGARWSYVRWLHRAGRWANRFCCQESARACAWAAVIGSTM